MQKILTIAGAATALSVSTALAGGYEPPVVETQPVVAPIIEAAPLGWTGGYVGANLNYGKGKYKYDGGLGDELVDGLPSAISKPDGASAALRAGYDWQNGPGVFGVGAEYNFGKYKAGPNGAWADLADGAGLESTEASIKRAATVFARAGYAFDDAVMAYGLLGYTWAKGEVTGDNFDTVSADLKGPTIGLGAEYKFADNWSGYAEYAYTKFKSADFAEVQTKPNLSQVKLGVNFRF